MFRTLLFFSLLLAAVLPLTAADPSEQFLNAYQSYQQGENLERSGNTSDAINKYRFAESLLIAVSKNDPSWQKPVIEYRLKKTRDALERLQGASSDSGGADATISTVPSVAPPAASPPDSGSVPRSSPVGPSISITPPSASTKGAVPAPPSGETRRLRQTIEDLKGQLQEANDALSAQKRRSSDLENAEWVKKRSQLTGELDVAKRRISDLERDLKSRDSWGNDLKNLQKKLDEAVADKLATEEQFQGSVKKLGDENAILARQLQEAQGKVVATADSKQKIEQLTQEVEKGKEANAQLQSKLDHSEQTAKDSLVKNDDLQKQLTETTEKLVVAQKQTEVAAPLHDKIKELQARVDQDRKSIRQESAIRADVQVLQEDRDRLMQKVAALGVAASEASKVKGLTAETEMLKHTVADLKGKLQSGDAELEKARAEAKASNEASEKAKELQGKNLADSEADRAVLQEEKERLLAKLKRASLALDSLKSTADKVPALSQDIDQLKKQLAENSGKLDQSAADLAEARKAETSTREAMQNAEKSAKGVTDLLTQQNKSLESQLEAALGKVASSVDHTPESAILQEQVKKLQEQVQLNAKNFADSQSQLAELAKNQPEQKKALDDKQKALDEARKQAADLQAKLADSSQQLEALRKKGNQGEARLKELQDQLLERDAKIASIKKKKGNAADEQIVQENELLRGIVLREIKDEARKSQAHRLMEEELKRLNVQSDTLQQQMTQLAAPAVELTQQERALFKDAQLVVSDQGGESVEASISVPMSASGNTNTPPVGSSNTVSKASTNGIVDSNQIVGAAANATNPPASQPDQPGDTNAKGALPWQGKFKELLAKAKEEFDRQDYLQAEDTFQEALKLSPSDYFALSNYGVVEFQLGKMKEAEEALKKASAQSSESSFALTTLGIVHYRQQRPEDAEAVLRKAVAINDKDFTAHNYLGIVLAAGGKGKAGESEIMKAVEINPGYADAHFNLAVIYATGKPPAKMLAKKHYQKALELGSPPDASLDRMLQ